MVLKTIFFIAFFGIYSCSTEPRIRSDKSLPISKIDGETLFLNNCASCHGVDGKLGMSGAKNLTKIILSDKQITKVITYGKGTMPAFKELIPSAEEIEAVVQHVRTLKTKK